MKETHWIWKLLNSLLVGIVFIGVVTTLLIIIITPLIKVSNVSIPYNDFLAIMVTKVIWFGSMSLIAFFIMAGLVAFIGSINNKLTTKKRRLSSLSTKPVYNPFDFTEIDYSPDEKCQTNQK